VEVDGTSEGFMFRQNFRLNTQIVDYDLPFCHTASESELQIGADLAATKSAAILSSTTFQTIPVYVIRGRDSRFHTELPIHLIDSMKTAEFFFIQGLCT
jgi:hypothetical protein